MIQLNELISLRAIKPNDQSTLYALMQRIYPPAYKHLWHNENCNWYLNKFYSVKPFQLELKEKNAYYYFVNYKGKLTGILRFIHNKNLETHPKTAATYLNRIYLGPESQGKGVAQAIFNWVEHHAKEQHISSIWLKAMDTQEQALAFYKKQGYEIVGRNQLDFSLLRKTLRGMYVFKKLL